MRLEKMGSAAVRMVPSAELAPISFDIPAPMEADVVDLRGYFNVEAFAQNSVIYRPGDEGRRVYLLKRGRVRLVRQGLNGERSILAILRSGDLFGDVSLGSPTMREEMAVAAEDAEVWSIEGSELKGLVESRPALALDILKGQSEQLRHQRRRLLALTFKEVPARLADAILSLSETLGERCPHGGQIDLRGVTQQDLADLVGASRSFVSTLINEMKRDGVLGNVGRTLCIKNETELRRRASQEK